MYVELGPILTVLGMLLTLSVLVERILKVADWFLQRLLIVKRAAVVDEEGLEDKLEMALEAKMESDLLVKGELASGGYGVEIERNSESQRVQPDSRFEVVQLPPPDYAGIMKEFYMQLIGFMVALIGCRVMGVTAMGFFRDPTMGATVPTAWEYILTAVIIGAGSKPIHFLIEFLVTRKIELARSNAEEKAASEETDGAGEDSVATPTVTVREIPSPAIKDLETLVGFKYDGGDRPDRLENTHLRPKNTNVDLIVAHHTTLHSDASFADLVKVFDNKGWLTGYHCVVFADGSIRALCRWDRYGNHALGCNERALGLAFQGNFEPDPRVPFSNPNGRYGILYPTEMQLDSAARIAALWSHLYKVPLRFPPPKSPNQPRTPDGKTGVVPHNLIADKACPGSNFPFDRFAAKVRAYHEQWKGDAMFTQALADFAGRPMVGVGPQSLASKSPLTSRKGVRS